MAIRVALNHRTEYRYDRLVTLLPQLVRLRPAPHCKAPIRSYSLRIEPEPHFINWQQDPHSNHLARVVFPEQVRRFVVEVDLVAEIAVVNPFDFFLEEDAEHAPFVYDAWLTKELTAFLEAQPAGPLLAEFVASIDRTRQRTVDFLVGLNQRLSEMIRYEIRMEPGVQTPEETLARRSGSCRDSAWLLVQVLRHLGLAARFVSGYLIQLQPDEKPLAGPAGATHDFTDLHAWTEVYLPGAGWVGLDPTSGLFAGEGHLPLAATPEPFSAAPIAGALDECEIEFGFAMKIARIHEDPRVTKPYSDAQWERIDALGERIDAELEAQDVRLTMGGEPTFVAVDDMDGEEWNYTAMGPEKRRRAEALVARLRERSAPGGLVHAGQGKWYPGEPLPRWALSCIWRRDGAPLWRNPARLALSTSGGSHDAKDADRFAGALAKHLGLDAGFVVQAYEDPWPLLRAEGQLPIDVDPIDNKLDDPQERERLRRIFDRGLATPVGCVLPIEPAETAEGARWNSSSWTLRAPHLSLIPGDSPMGMRLPLASLPWLAPKDRPSTEPLDPMAPREPFADHPNDLTRVGAAGSSGRRGDHQDGNHELDVDLDVVRTALCVEARDGQLHVFMPPLDTADDYLALLAAVENIAEQLDVVVVLEGYAPPYDSRLERVVVTPDPGVIEVNVRPVARWRELVDETTALYEDARQIRLGTEKFMLDGRHTGTGGGNHVVLGGATPPDSPFLRRPDLLKSLLGYWFDHPSLSYLFSGLFVGPTSQAPRIDEARHESVYEMEIAFAQIPERGQGEVPPWLVDRVFRHLLTDVTGNTHRAEFCIDKLYSPDTSTGRLGLLELRAFEMPPHARMSLTQQLLLRALVATFWREPYRTRLPRWGTQLHDRFLLPWFVDQDFRLVLDDLAQTGHRFEREWFASHFEFRFPRIGRIEVAGIELELRTAIEPWHVLGEEPSAGGTSRYVDSSLERVQVRVAGLANDRHVVACNGRRVPLHPTGTHGEFVAGVRYRAWQPPSCLHPTIPVHAPLVFDLVDVASERSVGGCTHHVTHPGGRNYETFPVNAYEAEARRGARFEAFGHSPGAMVVPPLERNPDLPMTLDLRTERR
jgi:uncharacterized protein (DUF2126 family)